jgi:hypothetical protein
MFVPDTISFFPQFFHYSFFFHFFFTDLNPIDGFFLLNCQKEKTLNFLCRSNPQVLRISSKMACHGDAAHQQVLKGLQKTEGKQTPFSLLYDKKGSELYKEITRLEEYYPFLAEDKMLELHVDEITAQIPPQSLIVELGCGTACKTAKILSAIQAHHGR